MVANWITYGATAVAAGGLATVAAPGLAVGATVGVLNIVGFGAGGVVGGKP